MSVCCVCCVLSGRGRLLRADPSSRGVLPSVCVSISIVRCNIILYTCNVGVNKRQSKKDRIFDLQI
jgi:hypothetical protein